MCDSVVHQCKLLCLQRQVSHVDAVSSHSAVVQVLSFISLAFISVGQLPAALTPCGNIHNNPFLYSIDILILIFAIIRKGCQRPHRCFHSCCLTRRLLRGACTDWFDDIPLILLLVLLQLLCWDNLPCYHSYWSIQFCNITLLLFAKPDPLNFCCHLSILAYLP